MIELGQLPILILYPHSRCNCRCLMCDIWKVDTVEEISAGDLDRLSDDLAALGVRRVVLSGGEPLLHSDLPALCRPLRRLGIVTTLLSSGLLLEQQAGTVAEWFDDVIVSLDGPPPVHDRIRGVPRAFERLESGIRSLQHLRPGLPIAARCTVQRRNRLHLCDTVRTAASLGLKSVSFLAADMTSEAFNRPAGWPEKHARAVYLDAAEIDGLEEEIERLIGELPDREGFVPESPDKLRRIVRHFRAYLGLVEPAAPRCNAPWVSAVIEADGTVRPCFFHRPIGNVRNQTLREAVNGEEAARFRSGLDVGGNPVCRRCVCSLYLAPES